MHERLKNRIKLVLSISFAFVCNQSQAFEPNYTDKTNTEIQVENSLIKATPEQLRLRRENMFTNHAPDYNDGAKIVSMLEDARNECGFGGKLEFDKSLSESSKKHSYYIRHIRYEKPFLQFNAHEEGKIGGYNGLSKITGKNNPYYSGKTVSERVRRAGFKKNWGENIVELLTFVRFPSVLNKDFNLKRTTGRHSKVLLNRLLSAPYHTRVILNPSMKKAGGYYASYVDKEISYNAQSDSHYLVINASLNKANKLGHKVLTYPCANSKSVLPFVDSEYPNPSESLGIDITRDAIGHPIYVTEQSGEKLTVKNISLVEEESNNRLDYVLLDSHNDKNKLITENEVFIVPKNRLKPDTKYRVSFLAHTKSITESRSFSFKTGSNT